MFRGLPAVLALIFIAATGCETLANLVCEEVPDEPIESFELTITTGDESCDCDVQFCFKRYSELSWECGDLDGMLQDDFESGETETYTVIPHPAVEVDDLESFEVANTNCGFFNTTLSISWIEVLAIDDWGDATLLYEEDFYPDERIHEDEALAPNVCRR